MAWHLAPALAQLRAEVNKKWPKRSKASDGTIGDPAHSARVSDHNPNGRGSVNAMDITARGIDTGTLIAVAKKHPSVRYIIHNRRIMNRDIGNFAARPYRGANPHTQHVHISLYQSATAENRKQSWGLANAKAVTGVSTGGSSSPTYKTVSGSTPLVKLYHKGEPVKRIQKAVGVKADSYYGPSTVKAVKAFQKAHGLDADGIVGPDTWRAINGGKKAPKPSPSKSDPFPLPKGHFYYTEDRRSTVHSGYWSKDRPAIRKIQKKVVTGVDGGYGAKTKAAVMRWQRSHGLKADGAVGVSTWNRMF